MEKNPDSIEISGTAKQTAAIMAGKIIALVATFAMPLFLTRFLSKSEFGLYSQFYILINFLTIIFSLGVQSNLYYFYPKASEQKQKSLIVHTVILLLIFTLVAIGLVNVPLLNKYLVGQGELINYTMFISLGVLFLLPVIIIEPLYVARVDNLTSVFYPPAVVLSRLMFVIGFAVIWQSLNSVMFGIISAGFVCFLFVMFYALRGIEPANIRKYIDIELAVKQFKYSWPFGLALVLNTLALQFDKIICISFLAPAAFATYAIAFYGIPGVEQVYQSLSQVYLIKMAEKHHENKPAEISEIYKSLVTKTYSFSVPAIVLVSLYAERIIVLFFTAKYVDAVPLFRIYILSFLIFMLGAGLILRATDRTILSLKAYFFSSILTIPLTYFLIKYYGIWGGITSAMISIILPKTIQLRYEMKLVESNVFTYFPWRKFLRIAVISITAIFPFALIEYFFDYGNFLVVFFGLVYLLIVSLVEMKYGVFVFDGVSVDKLIRVVTGRLPLKGYIRS
ncbi:lipopolysaccharide biosynthesis protein [Gaoshiqia sediminis]|uniref:Oligosaccharide flippase family protein n=1 Tax=Gaoshiqia sediminis TaxID=2986998 RepID=A0AA41Y4B8_9BACT|nr:oligosaccharide flippase family protein [Gaoshiqia sediminis]MCW0481659.1 oligosaccharide flippase family protein [Gaoshiqia sediminis]